MSMRTLLCLSLLPFWAQAQISRPNILFIAVDDLNDWGVTAMGGRKGAITPNLDRLAARGMLFSNAQTASPACHPSRTAIMTGVHPLRSGIQSNGDISASGGRNWRDTAMANGVLKNVRTLPEFLRAKGYRTLGTGKLFHALEWSKGSQNDPAIWDAYWPDAVNTMPAPLLPEVYEGIPDSVGTRPNPYFRWQALDAPDSAMADHKVVDWASVQLSSVHTKPFFLGVGLFRPHIPFHVPRKYFDMYPLDKIVLPDVKDPRNASDLADAHPHARQSWHKWVVDNRQWEKAVQGYLASVTYTDTELGRLLSALDAGPNKDNTVIVLWSDHGWHLGEKENWEKFTLWEESCRVPFMISAPGITRPNSVHTGAVSLLDIYPTLMEIAGARPEGHMDGESLVPILKNGEGAGSRAVITSQSATLPGSTVRDGRWRYIAYEDGRQELYDHATDGNEFVNLADSPAHRGVLAGLKAKLFTPPIAKGGANRLRLSLPAGGGACRVDSACVLQWTAQGNLSDVSLRYSIDGEWRPIPGSGPAGSTPNTGFFRWFPPAAARSDRVRVRISSPDGLISDESLAPLRIEGPAVSANPAPGLDRDQESQVVVEGLGPIFRFPYTGRERVQLLDLKGKAILPAVAPASGVWHWKPMGSGLRPGQAGLHLAVLLRDGKKTASRIIRLP